MSHKITHMGVSVDTNLPNPMLCTFCGWAGLHAPDCKAVPPRDLLAEVAAERNRLREALELIAATKNTKNICHLHGGDVMDEANPDECWCGVSLDAEEKMRSIAHAALNEFGKEQD